MKFIRIFALLAIGLAVYSSCKKENVDLTDRGDDNVIPDTTQINCDSFAVNINVAQDSAGFILTANHGNSHPPYTYAWSTGATTQTILTTAYGNYSVTVTDSEGCTSIGFVSLVAPDPCQFFYLVTQSDPIGNVGVTPVNGTAPYTYSWSTGATLPVIMTSPNNTYTVTVTDAAGCSATAEVSTLFPCDSLPVIIDQTPTGAMVATMPAGQAPYTYSWSTGAITQAIITTATGWYSVTVTDANGCQGVGSTYFINSNPCASLGVNIHQDSLGQNTISAAPYGGTVPYAYNWSNGATNHTIPVSTGNTYTVTVVDAQGCTATKFIQL